MSHKLGKAVHDQRQPINVRNGSPTLLPSVDVADYCLLEKSTRNRRINNRYVTVMVGSSLCVTSEIPCVLGRLKYFEWLNNRNRFNYTKRF